jgi:hypothetical protein
MIDEVERLLSIVPDPTLMAPPGPPKVDAPRDWPALFARGVELVRRIIPELAAVPFYIMPADQTPFANDLVLSMTGPLLDLAIRDVAVKAQIWAGRGCAIVLNRALAETYYWPGVREETLIGQLIVHEVCHAISDGWIFSRARERDDFAAEGLAALRELVKDASQDNWFENPDTGGATGREVLAHDDRWLRCCCHLAYRLNVEAFCVIGRRPELSDPELYLAALGDEPERMAGAPLQTILDSEPPEDFLLLWMCDLQQFNRRRLAAKKAKELSPMSVLEKILATVSSVFRQKSATDSKRFADVVSDLTAGKDTDATVIVQILENAGKTPADLEQEIKKRLHRLQLLQTVKRADGIVAEEATLDQKEAELTEPIETATRAYHAALPRIQERRRELNQLKLHAFQAQNELAATCADEALHAKLAKLKDERVEMDAKTLTYHQQREAVLAEGRRKKSEAIKAAHGLWNNPERLEQETEKAWAAERALAAELQTNIDAGNKAGVANATAQEAIRIEMSRSPV